ncbi:hypothetical protein RhiirC2_775898 [Rhizophagus irregularis]|uniref:Uncharacterized protein n=1 Tax=Rhizophagus irregularis TaxID=588596 RepID=A0A2N1NHY5_9GLOM|nr:hypothetical protein RhiirC2_775898 [Rhizophagus irregularis]
MSRAISISSQFRRIRYFFVDIQGNPAVLMNIELDKLYLILLLELDRNGSLNILKKEEIRNPGVWYFLIKRVIMNRNLMFAFLLLAALAMVNAVPYQLLKRDRDIVQLVILYFGCIVMKLRWTLFPYWKSKTTSINSH